MNLHNKIPPKIWITKSMKLNPQTHGIRERIKQHKRYTDEELEQYFILAVLYAHRNRAKFTNDDNDRINELYKQIEEIYQ